MSSLRSNLLISLLAMLLIGGTRPVFNAVVNRYFGSTINGQLANQIALFFLASLPATASLPTALVRYVSAALAGDKPTQAAAYLRLGSWIALVLTFTSGMGVIIYGRYFLTPALSWLDLGWVLLGLVGYTYWRIYRSVLVSLGQAAFGLRAEFFASLCLGLSLVLIVIFSLKQHALGAFVLLYACFAVWTLPTIWAAMKSPSPIDDQHKTFFAAVFLWFVGSGLGLATKELAVILLYARTSWAVVGDFSVAMAFLSLLALVPRVIEYPIIHAISQLRGDDAQQQQRLLINQAMHVLSLIMLIAIVSILLLAAPILNIFGSVQSEMIRIAFCIIAIAFAIEMWATPATNLLISESSPSVLANISIISFVVAILGWLMPGLEGLHSIVLGLFASHLVRGLCIAFYAKWKFQITLLPHATKKFLAAGIGVFFIWLVETKTTSPLAATAFFILLSVPIFFRDLTAMLQSFTARRIDVR